MGQWTEAKEHIERSKQLADEVTLDVRDTIVSLKNSAGERVNFIVMLREYLEWYEKTYGISIRLELAEKVSLTMLNRTREVQLLRIIKEALTNVRKHAKAKQVTVSLLATEEKVVAAIIDDGRGFDTIKASFGCKSYGLQIMRERAEEAQGLLEIQSKLGEGTTVHVVFPLLA